MSDDYNDRNFDDLAEKFARKVYGGPVSYTHLTLPTNREV